MTIELVAPLTEALAVGVVTSWNCRTGDRVRRGDALGEVETEKATLEISAPEDGVIEAVFVSVGAEIQQGTVLARLVPRSLGNAPSDLEGRPRPAATVGRPVADAARCRFCHAIQVAGRHDCIRCGAPL